MPANFYADQLRRMTSDPSSFSGSPGFKFALDTGLEGVRRRAPGGRGSGGAMAALTKYGTDLATQDYGNHFARLLQGSQLEQQGNQFDASNALARDSLALQDRLGTGRLALDRDQMGVSERLAQGAQGLQRRGQDMDFGLGTFRAQNDFDLGMAGVDAGREGRWWDYDINRRRLNQDAAGMENNHNLNWFNAQTGRGAARSQDWQRRMEYGRRSPYGAY